MQTPWLLPHLIDQFLDFFLPFTCTTALGDWYKSSVRAWKPSPKPAASSVVSRKQWSPLSMTDLGWPVQHPCCNLSHTGSCTPGAVCPWSFPENLIRADELVCNNLQMGCQDPGQNLQIRVEESYRLEVIHPILIMVALHQQRDHILSYLLGNVSFDQNGCWKTIAKRWTNTCVAFSGKFHRGGGNWTLVLSWHQFATLKQQQSPLLLSVLHIYLPRAILIWRNQPNTLGKMFPAHKKAHWQRGLRSALWKHWRYYLMMVAAVHQG